MQTNEGQDEYIENLIAGKTKWQYGGINITKDQQTAYDILTGLRYFFGYNAGNKEVKKELIRVLKKEWNIKIN